MSNQLAALHDIAMEFVDEALFAKKRGDETTAQLFYQKAYNLERRYALSIPKEAAYQLSRSIFLRSAATLALDCHKPSEASELAKSALEDNPHPAIVPELEEVLAKAEIELSASDSPLLPNHVDEIEKPLVDVSEPESNDGGGLLQIPRTMQLTIQDDGEADLLMALLQKFDSVSIRYLNSMM